MRIAITLVSVAFLVAGILLPEAAETFVRFMLISLALAIVGVLAYRTMHAARAAPASASPFDAGAVSRELAAEPREVRELADDLRAADRPHLARRTQIPRAVRWKVADEVARQLAERHGLRLEDPRDHDRIRELIATPTWALVSPLAPESGTPPTHPSPMLDELAMILDDLEAL